MFKNIICDNIKPYYAINEDGLIKNKNKIILSRIDKYGYKIINLSTINGTKTYKVHRLIMMTFNFIENHKEMTVNHKDGNKLNNSIENLEWMTIRENLSHAFENKLIYKSNKKINEDECHLICSYLEKGYSPIMISKELYKDDIKKYTSIIQDIKRKKNWLNISSEYDIGVKYKYGDKFKSSYSIFQLEEICRLISKKCYSNKQISEIIFSDSDKKHRYLITSIKNKKKYTNVSKNFF